MYRIPYEDIPCQYELGWQSNPPAIFVRLHKDCITNTPWPDTSSPGVLDLQQSFGFKRFESQLDKGFGFDGAFTCKGHDDHWFILQGDVPTMVTGMTKCDECKGIKKLGTCSNCNGSGKRPIIHWEALNAFVASYSLLLYCSTRTCMSSTSTSKTQLLTLTCILQEGLHGASMSGMVSKRLALWCKSLPEGILTKPTSAMRATFKHLMGELKDYDESETYLRVQHGNILANCPGQAAQIHPSNGWQPDRNEGYELVCHNLDNAWQQVTLLAGLASLHDLARESGI